ncbi:hypothetical protein [Listeria ilorinensis]|uniref:hypothetical protein n=1 Tax=Listeria ilorinensis TaxID=2867439 RepID=UPI001EF7411A|nr:hypothetical protein [Listeria ilorinensis]
MDLEKLEQNTYKIFVNRRLIFSNLCLWAALGIFIFLAFNHIKGINDMERLILGIFLFVICVIRPGAQLLNVMPTIELSDKGISYRGDFESYQAMTALEIIKPRIPFFTQGRLVIYTEIAGKQEVAFDILAMDTADSLESLQAAIIQAAAHFEEIELRIEDLHHASL